MKKIIRLNIIAIIIFIIMTFLGIYTNYGIPDYIVLPIFFVNLVAIFLSGYYGLNLKANNSKVKILNTIFVVIFLFMFAVLYLYILLLFLLIVSLITLIVYIILKMRK